MNIRHRFPGPKHAGKKGCLIIAAALAAAVIGTGTAQASTTLPANGADGQRQWVTSAYDTSVMWWLDNTSVHILRNTQGTPTIFKAVYIPAMHADELQAADGSIAGQCLGQDGTSYDLRSPCSATKAFDLWQVGSGNTFSELSTIYGWDRGDCLTFLNYGARELADPCNGMSALDQWEFVDQIQG